MLSSVVSTPVVEASRSTAGHSASTVAAASPSEFPVTPTQALLVVSLIGAFAYVWYVGGRDRWRSIASERLLYGVPWGTMLTLSIVLAFYLLAQRGLWQWTEPLYLPFVSWSYFYPTGLLTAGVAHGSPEHLLSNVMATLALGPIAEYAWSHYPPASAVASDDSEAESPGNGPATAGEGGANGGDDRVRRSFGLGVAVLDRPWVRALVVFPVAVLVVSYVTSMLSLGPSLGFSGAVFAIAGFALVTYPLASVVAILVGSSLGTLYRAFTEPVVRETVQTGPPTPPSWAGIAFQAHFLGFLIGVLLGLVVLYYTARRPEPTRIFFATVLFGMVQGLWLIVLSGGNDAFVLYRGIGVVVVLAVSVLITAAVAGVETDGAAVIELPSARPVRLGAMVILVALMVLIVLPSPLGSTGVVDAGTDDGETLGGVTVEDYTVTYAENATSAYQYPIDAIDDVPAAEQSGVVVVNPDRNIWTVPISEQQLAHAGSANVSVGGVRWQESVRVERSGWTVLGSDTAYAVDLVVDGERTRAFRSEAVTSAGRIDGYDVVVQPTTDEFQVSIERDGRTVGADSIPPAGQSSQIGDLSVTTGTVDDTTTVFVESADTRVPIAERETFGE